LRKVLFVTADFTALHSKLLAFDNSTGKVLFSNRKQHNISHFIGLHFFIEFLLGKLEKRLQLPKFLQ